MYSGKKRMRASFSQVDLRFMLSEHHSRSEDGHGIALYSTRGFGSMRRMKKSTARANLRRTQKK